MISIIKKTAALIAALCILVCALTSCDASVDGKVKRFVNDFFAEVEAGNYEEAETYLHPMLPADLAMYFGDMESKEGIDFQDGIKIERYISYTDMSFDTSLNANVCELKIRTKVSGVGIRFNIGIMENADGYGIYSFKVDG
jgi:hypothetical protein